MYSISDIGRTITSYWRQRAGIRELSAFDDRQLKDIGISRSQIPFAVIDSNSGDDKEFIKWGPLN